MDKTYSEMAKLRSFEERFNYLKIGGLVGEMTFGGNRRLNQILYKDPEWRRIRDLVISRDNGCDLGLEGFTLYDKIYVHHINPIHKEDILERSRKLFDLDNLVCVSFNTHQAIHYGTFDMIKVNFIQERKPNDTIPWR